MEQKWSIFGTFHRHCSAQFQPVPAAGRHCSASVPASVKPSAGTPVPSAGQTADLDHQWPVQRCTVCASWIQSATLMLTLLPLHTAALAHCCAHMRGVAKKITPRRGLKVRVVCSAAPLPRLRLRLRLPAATRVHVMLFAAELVEAAARCQSRYSSSMLLPACCVERVAARLPRRALRAQAPATASRQRLNARRVLRWPNSSCAASLCRERLRFRSSVTRLPKLTLK